MSARPGAVDPPALAGGLVFPLLPGALCKGQDPRLWFPRPGGSPGKGKAVCRACPDRRDCLRWALAVGEPIGVWGGTSPGERAAIRARREAAAAGAGRP